MHMHPHQLRPLRHISATTDKSIGFEVKRVSETERFVQNTRCMDMKRVMDNNMVLFCILTQLQQQRQFGSVG